MPETTARDFALYQLDRLRLPDWKRDLVPRSLKSPEDPRDIALADKIVTGVIKNLALLEYLAEFYSERKMYQIEPLARKILAVGLYQLEFLTRVPASAAVDEAVEQTKTFGLPRASGFVNAVLRRATRVPKAPLPSESDDPAKYAQIVLSHPPELFARLSEQFGVEKSIKICRHNNDEPPTLARLFRGMTIEQLQSNEVTVTPHEQLGIAVVDGAKKALLAQWAVAGIAQVQDATSAAIVPLMGLSAGQTVLDRCAGLGTKTLQIVDLAPGVRVTAMDSSVDRCDALRTLLVDRTIGDVEVYNASFMQDVADLRKILFDRVLVDAPCSNSGVLARRPEARYTQEERATAPLTKLQLDILNDTVGHVAPGGKLVYSTCSIWPEENEPLIQSFLARHPEMTLEHQQLWLPSTSADAARYRDGGYVAVMKAA